MNNLWRKLDNTAKVFSVEEKNNNNTFRLSAVLNEQVEPKILKLALIKSLENLSLYKVKINSGLFWDYLEYNSNEPIIEEENQMPCKSINLEKNNEYLFKVTYFNNKINLDIFHVLTDGVGSTFFFKCILYNYLNLKYKIKKSFIIPKYTQKKDEYLKNVDKSIKIKNKYKKAFLIKEKSDFSINKTYHYILDLKKFKNICKKNKVTITEYLTAIYIFALYNSVYDKNSKKDIAINVPIDLRKYYKVESISNFFTCMSIEGNVNKNKKITFNQILNQVTNEFKNKLTNDNIIKYLARDVKLGTNIGIRLVPLVIKKIFMKYLGRLVNQATTSSLSNIGIITIDDNYKKYIDNIMILVNTGKIQKVKCSICSYENNLTVTINSNLINNNFEKQFKKTLKKYVGTFKLETNVI